MKHFMKIEILPLKYIDGHAYGEVVSRVIADVDQIFRWIADGIYAVIYRRGNDPWNVLLLCYRLM